MWRNADVVAFIRWLHDHNRHRPPAQRCGFYGLDLYSLHRSMAAVLAFLRKVDPAAAERARERYACFDTHGEDPQAYAYASAFGISRDCEDEVTSQLVELRNQAADYARRDGRIAADEYFFAEQNARLVANAEQYYRSMFRGRVSSWNLRDTHMAETLDAVVERLEREGDRARVCVWAHNSHLGDARATAMGQGGELNVGQLARQRYGRDSCLVGFTTFSGTVTAAHDWDEPAGRRDVRPGLAGSVESLFHRLEIPNFLLDLRDPAVAAALDEPRLERAIGVIYRPETERMSHYFSVDLPRQFDLVVHLDETSALKPLERTRGWEAGEAEVPETYPSAL
jgi:erythromycin esterase-like protein